MFRLRTSIRVFIGAALAAAMLLGLCACASGESKNNGPLSISVWTYYNGDQLAAFNTLIDEFNSTAGQQKGIVVKGQNLGSVEDLQDAVKNSADGKVGAEPLPNIFAAYADTAYSIDQMGLLADLAPYLSEEEREQYIEGYLEEGTVSGADSIKIFPVAKSVELMLVNASDFEPFAQETGVSTNDLATFEGLARVAQQYYEWTDAQTEQPGDGKAFFGSDSLANYFLIGAKQMGVSLVQVENGKAKFDFDKNAVRRLWDNYYIPYMRGYFDATGRYRSDDIKTGNIIALVGSSSGATYFPSQVTNDNGDSYAIDMEVLPCPRFDGGQAWAVQQGAGLAVIDSSDEEVQACVEFLKWFTNPSQNLKFSVSSGYLPVMKEANDIDQVRAAQGELDERMEQVLGEALDTVRTNELYTPQAFEHGTEFRNVLEHALSDLASQDAQAVREAVAAGASLDEAAAPFETDEYFDTWYAETKQSLEALVG